VVLVVVASAETQIEVAEEPVAEAEAVVDAVALPAGWRSQGLPS
jgi:hypothetical protein